MVAFVEIGDFKIVRGWQRKWYAVLKYIHKFIERNGGRFELHISKY
jgi:hypothetical protein